LGEHFKRGFKTWCEEVSVKIRKEMKLTSSQPLDPYSLADHLGVLIWQADKISGLSENSLRILLEDDPESWSAVTLFINSQYLIILNSTHRKGRQSNTITHEIAHILLEHKPARIDVSPQGLLLNTYDKGQEQEADWLGGALLLPRDALLFIKKHYTNMKQASELYGVSSQLLEYRLNITGVNNQFKRFRTRKTI